MLRLGCKMNRIARRTNKQQLLILRRMIYKPPRIEYVEKPERNIFQYVLAVGCVVVIGSMSYFVGNENPKSIINSMGKKHKDFITLMNKGETDLKIKDYDGALILFKQAKEDLSTNKKDNYRYYYYLGECNKDSINNYKEALKYCNFEESILINNIIGDCYYEIKEYKESIRYLENCLKIETSEIEKANKFKKLGKCYSEIFDYENAIECYRNALKYIEDDDEEKYKVFISTGECYIDIDNYSNAIRYFKDARKYAKSNSEKINIDKKLKECYIKEKRFGELIPYIEEDIKLLKQEDNKKDLLNVYYTLGDCYDHANDITEAIKYYNLVIKNTKDKTEKKKVYDKLIICYIKNGEYYKARRAMIVNENLSFFGVVWDYFCTFFC